jgi:hypothetical protein
MSGGEWKKQPSDVASYRSLEPGGAALPFGHHVRRNSSRRCPTIMRDSSGVLPPSRSEASRSSDFMSFKRSTMIV